MFSIVCLTFIMLNLYIGVLIYHYGEAQSLSLQNSVLLTGDQKIWAKMQSLIYNINMKRVNPDKKRSLLYRIIKSKYFEFVITFSIIGNIIILSMNYEGSSPDYEAILENFNYSFTAIFICEFLVKIIALGPRKYFKHNWNLLDFLIVFLSILDIILHLTSGNNTNSFLRKGPQIIRLFRIIRVVRMVKLLRSFDGMRKIMLNLSNSFWTIVNVALLLALIFYIFAILGVFIFKDIKTGVFIDNWNNFTDFASAILILLGSISGQSWSTAMIDCFNVADDCIPGETCGTSHFYT